MRKYIDLKFIISLFIMQILQANMKNIFGVAILFGNKCQNAGYLTKRNMTAYKMKNKNISNGYNKNLGIFEIFSKINKIPFYKEICLLTNTISTLSKSNSKNNF